MRSVLPARISILLFVIFFAHLTTGKAQQKVDRPAAAPFSLARTGDQFILRIADSLLDRDILVVSRIVDVWDEFPRGLPDSRGAKTMEQVLKFEKEGDRIVLKLVGYDRHSTAAAQTDLAKQNIGRNIELARFSISSDLDDRNYLVDVTAFINNDNDILYLTNPNRNRIKLNKVANLVFEITSVTVNPGSIEIRSRRRADGKVILDLNTSLVVLPKTPMRPRYADSRLNYFEQKSTRFENADSTPPRWDMITRWRLELAVHDWQRYRNKVLVEPAKPIVYYIDTATPERWVPYFMQAVDDWQKAFEKAGFKNAIIAKRVPKDSLFVLNDIRYSVIRYDSLKTGDATYSYIVDPRSGEIIQSNIIWNQGAAPEFYNRYLVLVTSGRGSERRPEISDSIKGEIIRFVIQHEIGHALGFEHNMMASNAVPVNKLRNKKWVERNGISPSIMDYARFNYVAQPGDNITARKGLINDIGDYDEWAVQWGYSAFPGIPEEDEKILLADWAAKKNSIKKFRDGGVASAVDPRIQEEDLGDDPVLAGKYGIKNLQLTMSDLANWAKDSTVSKSKVAEIYLQLIYQYNWFISHAIKSVFGYHIESYREGSADTIPAPARERKRSLDFIESQVFARPGWLLNQEVISRAGLTETNVLNRLHNRFLTESISSNVLLKIYKCGEGQTNYNLTSYLRVLSQKIFKNLKSMDFRDSYLQDLQKRYVKSLVNLIPHSTTEGVLVHKIEIGKKVKDELTILKSEFRKSLKKAKNDMEFFYLNELLESLNNL